VLDLEAPAGSPRQRTLLVQLVRPLDGGVPSGPGTWSIEGGVRVTPVRVEWAARASDADDLLADGLVNAAERDLLLARDEPVAETSWWSAPTPTATTPPTRLRLRGEDGPLPGFDPLLSEVDFSFKVECPSDFDCAPVDDCPPEIGDTPPDRLPGEGLRLLPAAPPGPAVGGDARVEGSGTPPTSG
jgi:hypothetical protein